MAYTENSTGHVVEAEQIRWHRWRVRYSATWLVTLSDAVFKRDFTLCQK